VTSRHAGHESRPAGRRSPGGATSPGVIEWLRPPDNPSVGPVAYLIWRDPGWLSVPALSSPRCSKRSVCRRRSSCLLSRETSGLKARRSAGLAAARPGAARLQRAYPFHRKQDALLALDRPVALVDGESFSWFGVRSLRFLESGAP
jgi:hypothetical protein